jgi:hypothetical protein
VLYLEENRILPLILSTDYEYNLSDLWKRYAVFYTLRKVPFLDLVSFTNLLKSKKLKFYKSYNSYILGIEENSFFIVLYFVVDTMEEFVRSLRNINQYDDVVILFDLNQTITAREYINLGYKVRFKKFVPFLKNRKIKNTVDSSTLEDVFPVLYLPYVNTKNAIKSILE